MSAPRTNLSLAAIAFTLGVGCSEDRGECRCESPAFPSAPAASPPAQDPTTRLGPPLDLRELSVSSSTESFEGSFALRSSELGSHISVRPGPDGQVCVEGEVGVVENEDYDSYWGAQIELDLSDAGQGEPAQPGWERGDAIGLAFELQGAIPFELRMVAATSPSTLLSLPVHCSFLTTWDGYRHFARFDDIVEDCWEGRDGAGLPEGPLSQLGWLVPASPLGSVEFDFCLSDLRLLYLRED
jgi:hypothetical protein